jgi:hypothetical protein
MPKSLRANYLLFFLRQLRHHLTAKAAKVLET